MRNASALLSPLWNLGYNSISSCLQSSNASAVQKGHPTMPSASETKCLCFQGSQGKLLVLFPERGFDSCMLGRNATSAAFPFCVGQNSSPPCTADAATKGAGNACLKSGIQDGLRGGSLGDYREGASNP